MKWRKRMRLQREALLRASLYPGLFHADRSGIDSDQDSHNSGHEDEGRLSNGRDDPLHSPTDDLFDLHKIVDQPIHQINPANGLRYDDSNERKK